MSLEAARIRGRPVYDGSEMSRIADRKLNLRRAEVRVDEHGDPVVHRCDYWPFGEEIGPSLDPAEGHRFTAHWREYRGTERGAGVLEGLDFMHAREYDWRIARFTAPDPARDGWNPYAYVSGNPVNFVDPWGLAGSNAGPQATPLNLWLAFHASKPLDLGFGGTITVTAEAPGWTAHTALMYLVGLMYNDWLRAQEQAHARVYDDPYREMLRVSGQGAGLAVRYEQIADLAVTIWSLGIPAARFAAEADGRVFRVHTLERMLERGIIPQEVLEAIWRGARYWDTKYGRWAFLGRTGSGRQIYVAVSEETGKVVTAYTRRKALSAGGRWLPWP